MVKLPIILTDNMSMDNFLDFYERVKTLSKELGLTVRSVIESCNINYDSYNSYKRYGNYPKADEALLIANKLNTTVEFLVTGKPLNEQIKLKVLKERLTDIANSL